MPSALDLIGHNQALQEHWLRRFFAFLLDLVILAIVFVPVAILLSFWAWNAIFGPFIWGAIWFLYAFLLEAAIGGTIGKKILSLRVVAIGANLDAGRSLIRNISRIHGLLFFLDWLIGFLTQGDPRQRYLDRIAGTTVTRIDQMAYMEEQFRMMQAAPHMQAPPPGAYPQPQAPPSQAVPAAPGSPQAPPPGGWQQQGWPGAPPPQGGQWPQHQWDEEGKLKAQVRFCTACGGQLVARGDGKMTCVRCGAVY